MTKMPRRGVGKRLDTDVKEAIELLAAFGWKASKIDRVLGGTSFADRMPDLRTIQRYVERAGQRSGPDEPWQRTEMAGNDALLVLDVLIVLMQHTRLPHGITRAQAQWLLWVRQAAPDLTPVDAWLLALLYLARERSSAPEYADLDAVLAFAPWRSEQARSAYFLAVREKRIPGGPAYFVAEAQDMRKKFGDRINYYVEIGGRRMTILELAESAETAELGDPAKPGEPYGGRLMRVVGSGKKET